VTGGSSVAGLTPGRSRDGIEAWDGSRVAGRGRWREMGRRRPDVIADAVSDASAGASEATRVHVSELRLDVRTLATSI
jgi:hypothetical protein